MLSPMLSLARKLRPLAAVLFVLPLGAGCIASRSETSGELPELDVEDPDPEKDAGGPKFCNPTGKQGAELKKCHEYNETLYREIDEEAKRREPWFNFAPSSWVSSREVESQYIVPVAQEDKAIKRLESVSLIELTADEAGRFGGKARSFPGRKPYLVRGLMYFREKGAFTVFEKDQEILVRHDSQGLATTDEVRTAVIVWLGFKPKNVYVDCQVSE